MATTTLPLDPVVNIIVNLAAKSAVRKKFNLALLMGDIGNKVDFGTKRLRTYTGVSDMLADGFTVEDRLYKAAALIFGQSKVPPKVAIGKTGTVTVPATTEGGTSTTRPETPVETLQACREEDGEWYVGVYCGDITDDEILACGEYTEAATPSTIFAYTTKEAACLDSDDGGIFKKVKNKNYRRVFGQYSTKHADAVCAIIGWAMGAMTGTINSAFTLAYKTEVGVETENASSMFKSQYVDTIKANNGNVFINRGSSYDIFEEGELGDGTWFDEMIYLDKYKNDMQLGIMDLLYQNNKIAQTEPGMTQIKDAIKVVCDKMKKVGFIAAGTWLSNDMLELKYGDTLPGGYLIQSEAIAEQSQADRDARNAPPIYVSLKLAGAIHHVTVQIDVNR